MEGAHNAVTVDFAPDREGGALVRAVGPHRDEPAVLTAVEDDVLAEQPSLNRPVLREVLGPPDADQPSG